MNYCLISKQIDKNGEFILEFGKILYYDKQTHSGVFISQNNRIVQKVSKDVYDQLSVGDVKQITYQFI